MYDKQYILVARVLYYVAVHSLTLLGNKVSTAPLTLPVLKSPLLHHTYVLGFSFNRANGKMSKERTEVTISLSTEGDALTMPPCTPGLCTFTILQAVNY